MTIEPPLEEPEALEAEAQLERAHRIRVAVLELAAGKERSVSVAIADRTGTIVHVESMVGAASGSLFVAEAVASAAALYGVASHQAVDLVRETGGLMSVPVAAVEGGIPLNNEGRTYGGIGIAGGDPHDCAKMLVAVMLSVA